MPKEYVEKFLAEYAENHDNLSRDTSYYEQMVDQMRWAFNIPISVIKKRMRQLGYYIFDGISPEVADVTYPSFAFRKGALGDNETYVIARDDYERLLREDTGFAELINSGRYVYLGYVICQLDAEYIDVESAENDIRLVLSEDARENAHKCLMKFRFRNEKVSNLSCYNNAFYLNKIPEYNEIVTETFELCEEDTGLNSKTVELIKEYNDTMNMLNSPKLSTFANTVVYHMQKKEIDDKELSKRIGLSTAAIEKIYKGITKNVNIQNVMALCIGLQLDSEECYDMFDKAGYAVHEDTMQNRAYRFLFSCTQSDLKECNKILRFFNQDEVPYHKGQ